MAHGTPDDFPQILQAVRARDQRLSGFVAQGSQVRILVGDIGRVGDDAVITGRHRRKPGALQEPDVQSKGKGIGLGHLQCLWAGIDSIYKHIRAGMPNRQRHGTAAGAKVQHRW